MRLLIYGDYECPYTHKALISVAQVRDELGDALVFWEMHDLLFRHQSTLADDDLLAHGASIGLDGDRFLADFVDRKGLPRIEADVESGVRSGVQGTPSIFINGKPHRDAYDSTSLINALRSATGKPGSQ